MNLEKSDEIQLSCEKCSKALSTTRQAEPFFLTEKCMCSVKTACVIC